MKTWILVILLFLFTLNLTAEQQQREADEIAKHIAMFISTDMPVLLDLRCGEWTPALSQSLAHELLTKEADLRDTRSYAMFDLGSEMPEAYLLSNYGLSEANLVQVDLNLKWQIVEHKSFFSYRSERRPVYSFVVKQLKLPQHQLLKVDTYDFSPAGSRDSSISAPRLRWFEPLIASTA
ncbi:MAG TPA: hypothetical protein P5342_07610, partial [Candidatus Cloacimonadota bacterium]|nr:hypothetical protein [Candidatus Cloacimonadota bacterium]